LIIKRFEGFELEKDQKNQPTDLFNRSEVTFNAEGEDRDFHVLYLRYFDEIVDQLTPFQENPVLKISSKDVYLKDIVALSALMTDPTLVEHKRIYINEEQGFKKIFSQLNQEKLTSVVKELVTNKQSKL
jgi:hypothetical protein